MKRSKLYYSISYKSIYRNTTTWVNQRFYGSKMNVASIMMSKDTLAFIVMIIGNDAIAIRQIEV